jgi:hypothetical protein
MMRRAMLIAGVLALGASGGALLGGCGGGTKTVSVSGAAGPTSSASEQTIAHTTSTSSTASTATAPTTTAPASAQTTTPTAQSTSATRTAPAPAFTKTSTQTGEAAANAEANAAADVVTAHGYTPTDISDYHVNQTLRVLIGSHAGSSDAHEQRAFFFLGNRYLGTDSSQASGSIQVISQSDTEVALAYALYRPHDSPCCPSGGQATVHFQLNDGQLVPLQPIPPASSSTGLARQ